jgi:hypothetical protein
MGILRNGILGTMTGKVSGVVGSTWKGRNTLRAYAKPSNPKSAAQVTQRGLFSFVVSVASMVLGTIITDFWNPFSSSISGFNSFCKANLKSVTTPTDWPNIKMAEGSLEPISSMGHVYVGAGSVLTWSEDCLGNGLLTDNIVGVVIDAGNNVAFVDDSGVTRTDETMTITIGAGRTLADIKGYLFTYRGSGASLEVSDSLFATASDF